jgi:hypothetical protein
MLMATALLAAQRAGRAQDFSWNVANGDYGTATSWNPVGNPGPFDTAAINNGGTANYTAGIGTSGLTDLTVGGPAGSSGTFNLTGGELQVNTVTIGQSGTGTATLNGGLLTVGGGSLFVGGTQDGITSGVGTLNVMGGATTQFSSGDDVQFGRNGTGTLNMSGGFGKGGYTVVGKFGTATWNHSGGVFDQDFGDIGPMAGGPTRLAYRAAAGTINLTGGVIHAGHGDRKSQWNQRLSTSAAALGAHRRPERHRNDLRRTAWIGRPALAAPHRAHDGRQRDHRCNGGFDMNPAASRRRRRSSPRLQNITRPQSHRRAAHR